MGWGFTIMAAAAAIDAPLIVVFLIMFQLVLGLGFSFNETAAAGGAPLVPAVIAFGDSIVDPGNNDAIATIVKCNFPPYGQDFIGHEPTGRFCNGKIPTDFIASGLGIKELLPPYLGVELSPEDILTGVSFASGATGYDPLTPEILNVISMTEQLELFREYKQRMKVIAGEQAGRDILSKALYIVCAGTDDIANTYFTTPFRQPHYDIPSYVNLLITSASKFLQQLIEMGAKKIGFVGLPPIGCVPSQRTLGGGILRECEQSRNQAALLYNSLIQLEIKKLITSDQLHGVKIVYIDIYNILLDLVQRPNHYGFEESSKGCCGTGELEVSVLCNSKTSTVCGEVNKYVFWDGYHPTERAYKIIVDNILKNYLIFFI